MSVCDFLKDSKCTVTSSLDYTDCSDYVPADHAHDFQLDCTKIEHVCIDATTDRTAPAFIATTDRTATALTITTPTYRYITFPGSDSITVNVPGREKVIKNIKVLKCRCCDAKLDSTKMYNNIIKCEYCDSDNYIELEDE